MSRYLLSSIRPLPPADELFLSLPIVVLFEIDGAGFVTKKIEIFADGRYDVSDEETPPLSSGSRLPDQPVKFPLEADADFFDVEVPASVFHTHWQRAKAYSAVVLSR